MIITDSTEVRIIDKQVIRRKFWFCKERKIHKVKEAWNGTINTPGVGVETIGFERWRKATPEEIDRLFQD